MDDKTEYVMEMINRNRCFFIKVNSKCRGIITYFLCNGDVDKYINKEVWEILDDNDKGDTVYVDILLTDKQQDNPHYSLETWRNFKEYIKLNHPKISYFRWNRFKDNNLYQFKKEVCKDG